MKKQLVIVGITLVLFAVGLSGCADTTVVLQTFTSEEGGFSVKMPGTPEDDPQTINSIYGQVVAHMFLIEKNDIAYLVMYTDYEKSALVDYTASQILDNARDGAVASSYSTLNLELIISINGYPGRELSMSTDEMATKLKACLVGNRMYTLSASTSTDKIYTTSISEFLDSFTLLSKTFTLSDMGWSDPVLEIGMDPPEDWVMDETRFEGSDLVSFYSQDNNYKIAISWLDPGGKSFSEFTQDLKEAIQTPTSGYTLISNTSRIINNLDAYEFVYTYSQIIDEVEIMIKQKEIIIDYRSGEGFIDIYYLATPPENYEDTLSVFEESLESFTVL